MSTNKQVVISLHGIRTRGVWQRDLVPQLAAAGLIPYLPDYGYFRAIQLLRAASLEKQVRWLVDQYDRIATETGCASPSVIAHSFGTLQIARLMAKYDHVYFDKVILAASIVPVNYPWDEMLTNTRVNWVVNDYGGKDMWPKFAARFVPDAGESGSKPFERPHRALDQVAHPHFGHSDYFSAGNFRRNWIPTLLLDKRSIVDGLNALIGMLARPLGLPRESLRCIVLAINSKSGCLSVVSGLHLGNISKREVEFSIKLDAVGIEAGPAIAFKQMREVRQSEADMIELARSLGPQSPMNKALKWSISLPIPNGADTTSAIGVLIIDGLQKYPEGALAKELLSDQNVFKVVSGLGVSLCAALPR